MQVSSRDRARVNNAKLQEVNTRLKRGEGWIGYRKSNASNGELIPSKFLYFAFYQGPAQKFVNSKTNDPEEAYRQLLDAGRATIEACGFCRPRFRAFATKT
jgi:hypothetical protein